jgi:TAP-like protein
MVGRRLDDFDFARMVGNLPHVAGLLVHAPADAVTPYREALRYFEFWQGAALLSPSAGGHHLGTPDVTTAIVRFVAHGEVPAEAQIQTFPSPAEHDLARHFSGM